MPEREEGGESNQQNYHSTTSTPPSHLSTILAPHVVPRIGRLAVGEETGAVRIDYDFIGPRVYSSHVIRPRTS